MLLSKRLMTVKSCPRKAGCVKNQAQSLIIKAALNTKEVDSWLHQDPNQKPSFPFFKPSCAAPLAKKKNHEILYLDRGDGEAEDHHQRNM